MPKPTTSVRSYLPIFLILLFISCNNRSKTDQAILRATDATLANSSLSIKISSTMILMAVRERAADPISKERAEYWLPKAELVTKQSTDLISYIENLKKEKQINLKQAGELYQVLKKHKKDILDTDSLIKNEFEESIILPTDQFDVENGEADFYSMFFKATSSTGTSTILSNIQNNVRVIENKLLLYCHSKTAGVIIQDYFPSLLVGQNKSQLLPGEILEINAGIGSFSYESKSIAIINGRRIQETGPLYKYRTKVPVNPGKYKIPVQVSFMNRSTGKDETHEIYVEYTVVKECDQ